MPEERVSIIAILKDGVSKVVPKITGSLDRIGKSGLGIVSAFSRIGPILGLLGAGGGVLGTLSKGLEEARQRSLAEERTLAALSGQRGALDQLKQQIASIPRIPGLDEDKLLDSAATLLNLGVAANKVGRALKAAVDTSAALGISIEQAVELVRAIETGGESRLIKRIPELRKLREEGRLAAEGIAAIEKAFGGSGENLANNVFAQIDAATERLNDQLSDLGDRFAKTKLQGIDFVTSVIKNFNTGLSLIGGDAAPESPIDALEKNVNAISNLRIQVDGLSDSIEAAGNVSDAIDLTRGIRTLDRDAIRDAIKSIDPEIREPVQDIFSEQIKRAVQNDLISATQAIELQRGLSIDVLKQERSLIEDQIETSQRLADSASDRADEIERSLAAQTSILEISTDPKAAARAANAAAEAAAELQKQKDALTEVVRLKEDQARINILIASGESKIAEMQQTLGETLKDRAKDARQDLNNRLKEIESLVKTGGLSAGEGLLKQKQAVDEFNAKLGETVVKLQEIQDASNGTAIGIIKIQAEVEDLRKGVELLSDESDDFFAGFKEGMRQGTTQLDTLREAGIETGRTLTEALSDGVVDIFVRGKQTVREWASELLFSIAEILIKFAVMRSLSKGLEGTDFGAFLGFGTGSNTDGGTTASPTQAPANTGGAGGNGGGGATVLGSSSAGIMNVTAATVNVNGGTGGVGITPGPGQGTGTTGGGFLESLLGFGGDALGFLRGTAGEGIGGIGSLLSLLGGGATGLAGLTTGSTDPLTQLLGLIAGGTGSALTGLGGGVGALGGLVGGQNAGVFSMLGPLLGIGGAATAATTATTAAPGIMGLLTGSGGAAALGTAGVAAAPATFGLSLLLPFLPQIFDLFGGLFGGGGQQQGGLGGFGALTSLLPLLFLEDGGLIPGPVSAKDNTLIGARTGEYVLTPEAVSHAGLDFVEAVNRRLIPKDFFRASPRAVSTSTVRSNHASGGLVGRGRGGRGMPVAAMVADDRSLERQLARGRKALQREFETHGSDYRRHLGLDKKNR